MLTELASSNKVVGVKQSRKAIRDGHALCVYIASDADPAITEPLSDTCAEQNIPVEQGNTMAQLGIACSIPVGASVVVVLR